MGDLNIGNINTDRIITDHIIVGNEFNGIIITNDQIKFGCRYNSITGLNYINTDCIEICELKGFEGQAVEIENLFVKGNNIFNIEGDVCINGIPIKSTLGYLIKKEFKELLNEHLVKDITKIVLNYLGNVLN